MEGQYQYNQGGYADNAYNNAQPQYVPPGVQQGQANYYNNAQPAYNQGGAVLTPGSGVQLQNQGGYNAGYSGYQ